MTVMEGTRRAVAIGLALTLSACQTTRPTGQPSPSVPSASSTPAATPTPTPEPTWSEPPTQTPPLPTPASPTIPRLTAGQALTVEWIRMVGPTAGWAIGGIPGQTRHFLRTSDGGRTWTDVTPPEAPEAADVPPRGATAMAHDGQQAWFVYSGAFDLERGPIAAVVWRTLDGGLTWLPSRVIEPPGGSGWFEPLAFGFLPDGFGWLMAAIDAGMMKQYIAIYTTQDAGGSWTRVLDPYADQPVQSCPKTGLAFADASHGWLTRDCAGLMDQVTAITTDDGGETWTELPLPAPPGLPGGFAYPNLCVPHSIRLESASVGSLAVSCRQHLESPGPDGKAERDGPHALYRTVDAGATWTVREYPGGGLIWLDEQRGWALGRSLYSTQDGGGTWKPVHQVNWDGQFSFVDPLNGWAVASNEGETALVQTADGGLKWTILKPVIGP